MTTPVTNFANNPSTTATSSSGTTGPAALTGETWTVTSSSAFPAASNATTPPTQFHIADPALPAEIIAVTNVSGTTWTVTRGVEGTTPAAHATGATYYQVASAADLAAMTSPVWAVRSVSANTTLAATDGLLLINAGSGSLVITLPSPASVTGRPFYLKRTDSASNYVTVNPSGSELLDGGLHAYLSNSEAAIILISDGTNWQVL